MIHILHDFPHRTLLADDGSQSTRSWNEKKRDRLATMGIINPTIDTTGDWDIWIEALLRGEALLATAAYANIAVWATSNVKDVGSAPKWIPMNPQASRCERVPTDRPVYDLCTHYPKSLMFSSHPIVRQIRRIAPSTAYGENAGFIAHARREFMLCNNDSDQPQNPGLSNIHQAIKIFAGRRVLWKQMTGVDKAYPVQIFDFREKRAELDVDTAFAVIHSGGLSSLQQVVPMKNEYRFFIVNGRIVSGAGCIETRTPLDRDSETQMIRGICDPWISKDRFRLGAVEKDPNTVTRLYDRARKIVEDIVADNTFTRNFVLDVFETEEGEVGVVELNQLTASGLYANDPYLIASALMEYIRALDAQETATLTKCR